MNRKLTTGTYATTPGFASIPEHAAVCFDDDGGLLAVTGPADDTESQAYARLFSAAPELLAACEYVTRWHREHDSGEGELYGLDFVTTCIAAIQKARGL